MESGCAKKDHNYEIVLPFKEEKPQLDNNRKVAEMRLDLLKQRFKRDPAYATEYTARMNDLLEKGYVEEAPEVSEEATKWFLPHFGVRHPQKEKVRVVFDCAAKYHGRSLNDTLLQGPDLTNPMLDVLVRFREQPYAFTADIEAMFMQVQIPESQRDYLRFLWWPQGNVNDAPREYRNTRHLFGAKSSPSCANLALHKTAEDHGAEMQEARDTIRQNFYVDDVLKSVKSKESAIGLLKDLKELCALGGFNLTKFNSNSTDVLQSVPREERARRVKELTLESEDLPTERALGVLWDTSSDALGFQVDVEKLMKKPITKRGMLSGTASCYDPLGLVAPCIVRSRILIQELFRLKVGWDDPVPNLTRRGWERWLRELQHLTNFRVPRCLTDEGSDEVKIELHHFADASQKAYGTASYVRTVGADGKIHCALLMSKARLAPLKSVSIPRLELTAAKLAVEVGQELSRALDVEVENVFWTDSTTVLKYIRNVTTRFHVFVSNRLAVIYDRSSVDQWRYVPSEENPADLVSRGTDAFSLTGSDLWKQGPGFLQSPREKWPTWPDSEDTGVEKTDPEVKSAATTTSAVNAVVASTSASSDSGPSPATPSPTTSEDSGGTDERVTPIQKLSQHYGSWKRLVRAVALLRRIFSLKKLQRATAAHVMEQTSSPPTSLTLSDLDAAEMCIVRDVQQRHFGSEVRELAAGKHVRMSSSLARLDPFLESSTLRVGGRLVHSPLSWATKHPMILPNKDRVVDLLIEDIHRKAGHEGRQHVMADLGRTYWVLSANSADRRVLSRCVSCRWRMRPPESQKMADLPEDRVQDGEKPFTRTGVIISGPFS